MYIYVYICDLLHLVGEVLALLDALGACIGQLPRQSLRPDAKIKWIRNVARKTARHSRKTLVRSSWDTTPCRMTGVTLHGDTTPCRSYLKGGKCQPRDTFTVAHTHALRAESNIESLQRSRRTDTLLYIL